MSTNVSIRKVTRPRFDQGRPLMFRVVGNRCDIWTWSRESAEVIAAKVRVDFTTVGVADYF